MHDCVSEPIGLELRAVYSLAPSLITGINKKPRLRHQSAEKGVYEMLVRQWLHPF